MGFINNRIIINDKNQSTNNKRKIIKVTSNTGKLPIKTDLIRWDHSLGEASSFFQIKITLLAASRGSKILNSNNMVISNGRWYFYQIPFMLKKYCSDIFLIIDTQNLPKGGQEQFMGKRKRIRKTSRMLAARVFVAGF